jgi:hypothetical protein
MLRKTIIQGLKTLLESFQVAVICSKQIFCSVFEAHKLLVDALYQTPNTSRKTEFYDYSVIILDFEIDA